MKPKQQKPSDKSAVRMLPPLQNLTLHQWAEIVAKVDANYQTQTNTPEDE